MNDFWAIIGTNDLTSSESVAAALAKVRERLSTTSPARLAKFDQSLARQLYELDRGEFFEIPVVRDDGREFKQSDDHFSYARCACILTGATTMAQVLSGDRSFAGFTAIRLQSAELLLYLAERVGEEVFGVKITQLPSPPIETGSNTQYWQ